MANHKKTSFSKAWLERNEYKLWLAPIENDIFSAKCTLCSKIIYLSNMGQQALRSHMSGKKHVERMASITTSTSLESFKYTAEKTPVLVEKTSVLAEKTSVIPKASSMSTPFRAETPKGMAPFLIRDETTKAEIMWCLFIVRYHTSKNSGGVAVQYFPRMFPDSSIASKMTLQKTKIAYTVNYGLAPYFFRSLQSTCSECSHIVIGFDESLNKVSQKGQMDVFVRLWDTKSNQVSTRYYCSSFLGHATSNDLLQSFKDATCGIDLRKVLQVSMDGPHVNFKFLRELKAELQKDTDPCDWKEMVELGSCGLHTMHNSYKKSMKINGWKIIEFLRSLYYLFANSPARRADYEKYSGSSVFPLKFCAVRWVENFRVAGRAASILPNVRKYIEGVRKDKIQPTSNSYKIVCSAIEDVLLPAKLAFFQTVAADVESFLVRFQSDNPLAPLLYQSLLGTIRTVMSRFIKASILDDASSLVRIDLDKNDNFKDIKDIDVGFSTRKVLKNVVKPVEEMRFRKECRLALIEFCNSIFKNSPLKYPLTKAISCFDPTTKAKFRASRLEKALEYFVDKNWISGNQADRIKTSFTKVCNSPTFEDRMKNFSIEDMRLDTLWMSAIPPTGEFEEIRSFTKLVLILSHGNAFAERGFSINKEMIIENLAEESIVSQRQVYDAIIHHGKIEDVEINKSMIHAARNAHSYYLEALAKKREKCDGEMKLRAEKRKAKDQVKELERKKRNILDDAQLQISALDSKIEKLI